MGLMQLGVEGVWCVYKIQTPILIMLPAKKCQTGKLSPELNILINEASLHTEIVPEIVRSYCSF